jgi:acetyl-CoA synthetase
MTCPGEKGITSMSLENRVFDGSRIVPQKGLIKSIDEYRAMWQQSVDDPDTFWGKIASEFTGKRSGQGLRAAISPTRTSSGSSAAKPTSRLNALDRHLATAAISRP